MASDPCTPNVVNHDFDAESFAAIIGVNVRFTVSRDAHAAKRLHRPHLCCPDVRQRWVTSYIAGLALLHHVKPFERRRRDLDSVIHYNVHAFRVNRKAERA